MKIDLDDLKQLTSNAADRNEQITMRDVGYVLLSQQISDPLVAYRIIHNINAEQDEFTNYDNSGVIAHLMADIKKMIAKKNSSALEKDISFEDNKQAMLEALDEIDRLQSEGTIEAKDAIKMKIDIRTRLNDKFKVSSEQEIQYVSVNTKFNFICPHTRKECYVATKEDLIERYGLVDLEQLKKKYDLVKKDI